VSEDGPVCPVRTGFCLRARDLPSQWPSRVNQYGLDTGECGVWIVRWQFEGPVDQTSDLESKPGVLVVGEVVETKFVIRDVVSSSDVAASASSVRANQAEAQDGRIRYAVHYTDDRLALIHINRTIRLAYPAVDGSDGGNGFA